MNQLLESLRERVRENLDTVHENELTISQILKEPLSSERSEKLKYYLSISKTILEENNDNLAIQHKVVAFLNKYKKLPEYQSVIDSLNAEIEAIKGKQVFNASSSEKPRVQQTQQAIQQESTGSNETDLFSLTVQGLLPFNHSHPKFSDENFYNKLMNFHISREEYEICSVLQKVKHDEN